MVAPDGLINTLPINGSLLQIQLQSYLEFHDVLLKLSRKIQDELDPSFSMWLNCGCMIASPSGMDREA